MNYNTDINIIGSIPDYNLIYRALPLLISDPTELEKILVSDNEFDFRTEKSRKRFLSALKSAFVNTDDIEFNQLISVLMAKFSNDQNSQATILFWVFNIQNQLFSELNSAVFLNYYFQGRTELPKEDVIAYIKDLISRTPELKNKWSEVTIETIASKYLTILKKLNLVEGVAKKKIAYIHLSDELIAIYVHLREHLKNKKSNFLEDEFLNFSFIDKSNIVERLKKVAKKDWISMNYAGNSLQVNGVFNSKNIIDGLY